MLLRTFLRLKYKRQKQKKKHSHCKILFADEVFKRLLSFIPDKISALPF